MHARIQRGGQRVRTPTEKSQSYSFLTNTGSDPLKIQKATKPPFDVGPSSAGQGNHHLNGVWLVTDDGPLLVVFGSSFPSSTTKKDCQNWTPSDKTLWIPAWHGCSLEAFAHIQ